MKYFIRTLAILLFLGLANLSAFAQSSGGTTASPAPVPAWMLKYGFKYNDEAPAKQPAPQIPASLGKPYYDTKGESHTDYTGSDGFNAGSSHTTYDAGTAYTNYTGANGFKTGSSVTTYDYYSGRATTKYKDADGFTVGWGNTDYSTSPVGTSFNTNFEDQYHFSNPFESQSGLSQSHWTPYGSSTNTTFTNPYGFNSGHSTTTTVLTDDDDDSQWK